MPKERDPFKDLRDGYSAAAEYYDLFASNDDIPFFLEYAKAQGSPILDVAAGAGRVTFTLAGEGFSVVALESSKAMLDVARRRHADASPDIQERVSIVEGNMTEFNLGKSFSLVIIPSSFGHAMTTEEQLSTLRCIRDHLSDDGLFILDLFPGGAQPELATFEDNPRTLADGRRVRRMGEIRTDHQEQILRLRLKFVIEGEGVETERIELLSGVALIFDREAELLLRIAGFEIVEEYGSFDKQSYSKESGRRILVLKKK